MSKTVFGLIGGLALIWTALFGWNAWVNSHRIVAGPANESLLYRSYDPEQVIKQFRDEREGHAEGGGSGAGRGIESIHHSREFTQMFTMQANRERELLNALREDIMIRLNTPGMNVVAIHDQATEGFTYRYISGGSVGSISVEFPAHVATVRHYPLPIGLEDVQLKIALDETWTRPPSETQWWMRMAD